MHVIRVNVAFTQYLKNSVGAREGEEVNGEGPMVAEWVSMAPASNPATYYLDYISAGEGHTCFILWIMCCFLYI